jgi:O-antigen/teichoic acid export membrane protein
MRRFGIRYWWSEAWGEWRLLAAFGLPAFLTSLIGGPVFWACNALLANQPDGYAELGVLNAANQWYMAVSFLPGLLMTAMLPILSQNYAVDAGRSNVRITRDMMKMTAILVVPVVIGLMLASRVIMRGYGATFVSGYPVLILSVITAGIHAAITPVWVAIMAEGRMWLCFLMNLGCSSLMLLGTYQLAVHGAVGFATARLVAYLAHGAWLAWYIGSRPGSLPPGARSAA